MKVTVEVDGGQARVTGDKQLSPQGSAPSSVSEPPSQALARAAETGAIAAGPAPTMPLGPGAPMQSPSIEPTLPTAGQGSSDTPAGAAPGAAASVSVESPVANDDTEEEGD